MVGADLFPDLFGVARGSVAVEVTQVTVDFVQVPLLKEDVRGGMDGGETGTGEKKGENGGDLGKK